MKTKINLKLVVVLFLIFSQLSAMAHVIIHREKVGGNKTNKFEKVSRHSVEASGITTVMIKCIDPGPDACPVAKPRQPDDGGDVEDLSLDPVLANHANVALDLIDEQFESGITSGSDGYTLQVTNVDGTITEYYFIYSWELLENGTEKSIIEFFLL